MATLVALSAYLFSRSGAGAVAVFGVVRAVAPAVGVPLVTAGAGRWPAGRVLAGCGLEERLLADRQRRSQDRLAGDDRAARSGTVPRCQVP